MHAVQITNNSYLKPPEYISAKASAPLSYVGPNGFHWLVAGKLGGTPRPGIFKGLASDASALKRLGIKFLVTLNENWSAPVDELAEYGIESHQVRIPDMCAPSCEQALDMCQIVDERLQNDEACAYHCRAGRGRTGTMLAAQMIYYGYSANDALTLLRQKNAKWIESEEQHEFIYTFEDFLM